MPAGAPDLYACLLRLDADIDAWINILSLLSQEEGRGDAHAMVCKLVSHYLECDQSQLYRRVQDSVHPGKNEAALRALHVVLSSGFSCLMERAGLEEVWGLGLRV